MATSRGRPSPSIKTTGLATSASISGSATTLTTTPASYRSPRLTSASTSNLLDTPPFPASYHSFRHPIASRPDFAPPSPSTPSHGPLADSQSTSAPRTKRSVFGTTSTKSSKTSAPSVRSSHTMPEMMAYNDVDQWGVANGGSMGLARPPLSPRKGSGPNTSQDSGLRRKNSSSKMLAKGLSRSLTRMGSVMKRSTSEAAVPTRNGIAGKSRNWPSRARDTRTLTVQEEMGEGWERVDMNKEVTEGDTSITRPFNVEHNLHISPDLDNLPPAWLQALKAQGLSEDDLLLIAAARQKASQRSLIRISRGPLLPDSNDGLDPTTRTSFSQARSRGLSMPAHLMLGKSPPQIDRPMLENHSWRERAPANPTAASSAVEAHFSPDTPLTAYRRSLLPHESPAKVETSSHHHSSDFRELDVGGGNVPRLNGSELDADMDATPKKTKRWSDQLRGFQDSFSTIGAEDDDWGSALTSVLNANFGLQTVQESEDRHQSSSSAACGGIVRASEPSTSGHLDDPHDLSIVPPKPDHDGENTPSPASPCTPRGNRASTVRQSWRKPVPTLRSPLASPRSRRPSLRSHRSSSSQAATPDAWSPPSTAASFIPPATSVPGGRAIGHHRYQSLGQSNASEVEHELRTPSTGDHSILSPTSSDALAIPHLPSSVSNDSQWVTQSGAVQVPNQSPSKEVVSGMEHLRINGEGAWPKYAFAPQTPPRPDPRFSLPATAGYTESSPPSRSHTPTTEAGSNTDHDHDDSDHQQVQRGPQRPRSPVSARDSHPKAPIYPSTPKYAVRKGVSPASHSDPLSRLDQAGTMSERASIALSVISSSNFSDARSSLTSLRDSYMHEAKVLKAYLRDPHAVELAGLRESDNEGTSEPESASDHLHDYDQDRGSGEHRGGVSGNQRDQDHNETIHSRSDSDTRKSHGKIESSPRSSQSIGRITSVSSKSNRSPKSSMSSGRSRRRKHELEPVVRQHPFAYQPLEADREEDALLALDDAARQIARHRGRLVSDASAGGKSDCRQ